jgi:predicted transcriptional regulator
MVTVSQVMTRGVLALRSDVALREAVDYLATQHISGAPVLDPRHRLAGVITTSDILQAESEGEDLDATTVGEVMTPTTLTVAPETDLKEAALTMEYADVHRLFVEQGGTLVGVISRSDVNRALATGLI